MPRSLREAPLRKALAAIPADGWTELRDAVAALRADPAPYTHVPATRGEPTVVDGVEREVIISGYTTYSPSVNHALELFGSFGLMLPFDWPVWAAKHRPRLTPEALRSGRVGDAVRIVIAIVRGDRFGEGVISSQIDNGVLLAAFERIAQRNERDR